MASKFGSQDAASAEAIAEMLDVVDKALERLKSTYEQYFLGIQKQAPSHLHGDVERKLRDLTQLNVRNTALRYRLATLQQKFSAYNAYWRRTLRQIENGTYLRSLQKMGRKAAQSGAEIPDEILAAMPRIMREQVLRDRERAVAAAKRRRPDGPDEGDVAAVLEPSQLRRELRAGAPLQLDESDADVDVDALFAQVASDDDKTDPEAKPYVAPEPAPRPPPVRGPPPAPPAPTGPVPRVPAPAPTGPVPRAATPPPVPPKLPSQTTRPNPIAPGAAAARGAVPVESMAGPFPRQRTERHDTEREVSPPARPVAPSAGSRPRPPVEPPLRPPPGMSDADVNALYAKYVRAKQAVGEAVDPGGYGKLLKTINAQAPKIMEQYKAKGVDFSVVVKDNQVIIRAKPKT